MIWVRRAAAVALVVAYVVSEPRAAGRDLLEVLRSYLADED